jgi:hypothetical protein
MGFYPLSQTMNICLSGQISYNSSLSNAFQSKLGQDVNEFFVDVKAATQKYIAEQLI